MAGLSAMMPRQFAVYFALGAFFALSAAGSEQLVFDPAACPDYTSYSSYPQ